MTATRVLSTAADRREAVVAAAITAFADGGFHTVPIAKVAEVAGISPAYVSKLFSSKTRLFVAALEECYRRILASLERGAESADDVSPQGLLAAMGAAYAELIADRDLLALQVHAQAAIAEPEIATTVRQGVADITNFAAARTGADGPAVQHFMAFGQLCHLLTTLDAFEVDEAWAHMLTDGIRHSNPERRNRP